MKIGGGASQRWSRSFHAYRAWAAADSAGLWPMALVCVTACVSLGFVQFVGRGSNYLLLFPPPADAYRVLFLRAWWVACGVVGFVLLPLAVALRRRTNLSREFNLSWQGLRQHYWLYIALYALVLPVIVLVSSTPAFYTYYPMYALAGRTWRDFLLWEGLYALNFIALEFFFRGFLVAGLGKYIGIMAVPVSAIPYMMVHFGKPWTEAYAAIVAGFILGWLAWKTKSIWGGVLVHIAVGVSMDVLALAHKHQLPWMQG